MLKKMKKLQNSYLIVIFDRDDKSQFIIDKIT